MGLLRRAGARAQHLLDLMDDWLTLARVGSGSVEPDSSPADLREVARQAIAAVTARSGARKTGVTLEAPPQPCQVKGNSLALREMVVNLVDNAIRYSPQDSAVRVRVDGEDGCASVRVEDHGPGIPPEEQKLIFEPFFRGVCARRTQGTGLGLAIAKQIAEAHGGHMEVESHVGAGTVFKVYLRALESKDHDNLLC